MPNEPGDQIVGYVVDDDTVRIGNDYYDLATAFRLLQRR